MTTHELAKLLLENGDLPVSLHVNNLTYISKSDESSHGGVRVGLIHTYMGDHICIGNFRKKNINKPNRWVKKMIHGGMPDE